MLENAQNIITSLSASEYAAWYAALIVTVGIFLPLIRERI